MMHSIRVSDEIYDYLLGIIDDAACENETEAEKISVSEAISRLIEDREST